MIFPRNNAMTLMALACIATVAVATTLVEPLRPETPAQRKFDGRYNKPGPTFGYDDDDNEDKPISEGGMIVLYIIAALFGLFMAWYLSTRFDGGGPDRSDDPIFDELHYPSAERVAELMEERRKRVEEGRGEEVEAEYFHAQHV